MSPEIRSKIIEIAKAEVGTTEFPANSNHTKYGKWFGLDGMAWCGIFCSYCYWFAGFPIKKGGFTKGFAGVGTALLNFKDKITTEPQMGDLVIFEWNFDNKPDHVGLFYSWIDRALGTFETFEGNTSFSNQSNGGQVMNRIDRKTKNVVAFINLID